jgi:fluoroquinolone resistance protein
MREIEEKYEFLSQNFIDLKLSAIELISKKFEICTFKECDFSDAVFNNCRFVDCHFIKCNFSNIKIEHSKFLDVFFDECKIIGVDWTNAIWPKIPLCSPIKFYKCIMSDSTFFGLNLEEIVMEECKAHNVDFREGNFSNANFTYTDFLYSMFNETNLKGGDFSDAINYKIDIYFNKIKGAKFSRYEAINLLESLGIELVD